MKILYLAHSLDPHTGWGRFSLELIERFIKAGVEAHIITEYPSDFPNTTVGLKRSFGALGSAVNIRRVIKDKKIDIIHSLEMNPYAISAYLANLGLKKKHVITATGAYSVRPLYQIQTSFLSNRAYETADRVCPISKYVEKEIRKVVKNMNSEVVTLGVDDSKFSGTRTKSEKPFILGVGNLSNRKGYQTSVAAFAEIAEDFPDLSYQIAGSKDEQVLNECVEILNNKKVDLARVVFLGSLSDSELKKKYLEAELFILTSVNHDHHFEGFGLVFLEAASAGLPVIGTTDNGIEDAVLDGVNGYLVKQYDVAATRSALRKILGDQNLKSSFSVASIDWAKKNSWNSSAEKYLKIYKEILKS